MLLVLVVNKQASVYSGGRQRHGQYAEKLLVQAAGRNMGKRTGKGLVDRRSDKGKWKLVRHMRNTFTTLCSPMPKTNTAVKCSSNRKCPLCNGQVVRDNRTIIIDTLPYSIIGHHPSQHIFGGFLLMQCPAD